MALLPASGSSSSSSPAQLYRTAALLSVLDPYLMGVGGSVQVRECKCACECATCEHVSMCVCVCVCVCVRM